MTALVVAWILLAALVAIAVSFAWAVLKDVQRGDRWSIFAATTLIGLTAFGSLCDGAVWVLERLS